MDETKGAPFDFVFSGIRLNRDCKKITQIILVEDGKLGRVMNFAYKRENHKVLGQVYTGAYFSEDNVWGLNLAKWVGPWNNKEDLIEWAALENESLAGFAVKKLEDDAKTNNEIERIMKPLRKKYFDMYEKFNTEGCRALREAVLAELTRKPKRDEQ